MNKKNEKPEDTNVTPETPQEGVQAAPEDETLQEGTQAAPEDETPQEGEQAASEGEPPQEGVQAAPEGETPQEGTQAMPEDETPQEGTQTAPEGEPPQEGVQAAPEGETPQEGTQAAPEDETPLVDKQSPADGEKFVLARILKVTKPLMRGSDIKAVQAALIERGFGCGPEGVNGVYGIATAQAVRYFQSMNRLIVNGCVDKFTVAAMGGVWKAE